MSYHVRSITLERVHIRSSNFETAIVTANERSSSKMGMLAQFVACQTSKIHQKQCEIKLTSAGRQLWKWNFGTTITTSKQSSSSKMGMFAQFNPRQTSEIHQTSSQNPNDNRWASNPIPPSWKIRQRCELRIKYSRKPANRRCYRGAVVSAPALGGWGSWFKAYTLRFFLLVN